MSNRTPDRPARPIRTAAGMAFCAGLLLTACAPNAEPTAGAGSTDPTGATMTETDSATFSAYVSGGPTQVDNLELKLLSSDGASASGYVAIDGAATDFASVAAGETLEVEGWSVTMVSLSDDAVFFTVITPEGEQLPAG